MAMTARIRRSRNSIRWVTNGCSVPASSSSWSAGGGDMGWRQGRGEPAVPAGSVELLRAVLCHTRGAGQRLGADAVAHLVPLRRGALLQAPLLAGVLVRGKGGRRGGQRLRRVGRFLPLLLEVGGRGL